MLNAILIGATCGTWAFLWCKVLTAPGMAGNIVPVLYWRIMGKHNTWKEQFAKPLFDCSLCHSFWVAVFSFCFQEPAFTPLEGFGVVVAALFSAYYLNSKYEQ